MNYSCTSMKIKVFLTIMGLGRVVLVGWTMTLQRCSCRNSQNLWLLPYFRKDLQMWLGFEEIIWDYIGRPNIIMGYFEEKGKRIRAIEKIGEDRGKGQKKKEKMACCWLWSWRKGPWTKESRWLSETGKGKEINSPLGPPEGMPPCISTLDF